MNNTEDLFRSIYEDLIGVKILPAAPFHVENAFAEGKTCEVLYGDVVDCKIRINDRLNVDEDPDVESIIDDLLKIGEILSRKMFEYGMKVQESRQ